MIDALLNDCGYQWTVAWAVVVLLIITTLATMVGAYFRLGAAYHRGQIAAYQEFDGTIEQLIRDKMEQMADRGDFIIKVRDE